MNTRIQGRQRSVSVRIQRLNSNLAVDNFDHETKKGTPMGVLREDKMDPPIHTHHFHSGGATTLIFFVKGANAVGTKNMRILVPWTRPSTWRHDIGVQKTCGCQRHTSWCCGNKWRGIRAGSFTRHWNISAQLKRIPPTVMMFLSVKQPPWPHRGWNKRRQFRSHALNHLWSHGCAAWQHDINVQILADVSVALRAVFGWNIISTQWERSAPTVMMFATWR